MTTKRKPYKTYPREFKLEALRLMEETAVPPARSPCSCVSGDTSFTNGKSNWLKKAMSLPPEKADLPNQNNQKQRHCDRK